MRWFLLWFASTSLAQLPDRWDARDAAPGCRAFAPYDERAIGCASCCPAAIAAAVGARDCLQNARNPRYSPAQIWDCAGGGFSTCEAGTFPDEMVQTLADTPLALVSETCGAQQHLSGAPNASTCAARYADCVAKNANSVGVVVYHNAQLGAVRTYTDNGIAPGGDLAMRAELMRYGPVVATLALTAQDAATFKALGARAPVFVPASNATPTYYHCVAVVGWDVDTTEGLPFFWVQNAYAATWGDAGFARVVRGRNVLERMWFSVSPLPRACPAVPAFDEPCLPPPRLLLSSTPISTTPLPAPIQLTAISNWEILGIAFASALTVTLLAAMVVLRLPSSSSVTGVVGSGGSWQQQQVSERSAWLSELL